MTQHRVRCSELDQSLRALIGSERIDKIIDDPTDPAYMLVITDDRFETRPTGQIPVTLTHAGLGIEARDQAS